MENDRLSDSGENVSNNSCYLPLNNAPAGTIQIPAIVRWNNGHWRILNPMKRDADGEFGHWLEIWHCEFMIEIAKKVNLRKDKDNLVRFKIEKVNK